MDGEEPVHALFTPRTASPRGDSFGGNKSGRVGSPLHWAKDKSTQIILGASVMYKDVVGEIKYLGTTHFAPGIWAGIALEKPVGLNDGSVDRKFYFLCKSKHGVFVKKQAVELASTVLATRKLERYIDTLSAEMNIPLPRADPNVTSVEKLHRAQQYTLTLFNERTARVRRNEALRARIREIWEARALPSGNDEVEAALVLGPVPVDGESQQILELMLQCLENGKDIPALNVAQSPAGEMSQLAALKRERSQSPQSRRTPTREDTTKNASGSRRGGESSTTDGGDRGGRPRTRGAHVRPDEAPRQSSPTAAAATTGEVNASTPPRDRDSLDGAAASAVNDSFFSSEANTTAISAVVASPAPTVAPQEPTTTTSTVASPAEESKPAVAEPTVTASAPAQAPPAEPATEPAVKSAPRVEPPAAKAEPKPSAKHEAKQAAKKAAIGGTQKQPAKSGPNSPATKKKAAAESPTKKAPVAAESPAKKSPAAATIDATPSPKQEPLAEPAPPSPAAPVSVVSPLAEPLPAPTLEPTPASPAKVESPAPGEPVHAPVSPAPASSTPDEATISTKPDFPTLVPSQPAKPVSPGLSPLLTPESSPPARTLPAPAGAEPTTDELLAMPLAPRPAIAASKEPTTDELLSTPAPGAKDLKHPSTDELLGINTPETRLPAPVLPVPAASAEPTPTIPALLVQQPSAQNLLVAGGVKPPVASLAPPPTRTRRDSDAELMAELERDSPARSTLSARRESVGELSSDLEDLLSDAPGPASAKRSAKKPARTPSPSLLSDDDEHTGSALKAPPKTAAASAAKHASLDSDDLLTPVMSEQEDAGKKGFGGGDGSADEELEIHVEYLCDAIRDLWGSLGLSLTRYQAQHADHVVGILPDVIAARRIIATPTVAKQLELIRADLEKEKDIADLLNE